VGLAKLSETTHNLHLIECRVLAPAA
jgi:hypothetical protein